MRLIDLNSFRYQLGVDSPGSRSSLGYPTCSALLALISATGCGGSASESTGGGNDPQQEALDPGDLGGSGGSTVTEKTPLLEGPEGGICFDEDALGLNDWNSSCTAPRDVDVACFFDIGYVFAPTTTETLRGLDAQGRINWKPHAHGAGEGLWEVGFHQFVFDEEGNRVLWEIVAPGGCVENRLELVPTETGHVRVYGGPEGRQCMRVDQSETEIIYYPNNPRCSCEESVPIAESHFDEEGRKIRALNEDLRIGSGWANYEYDGEGNLIQVVDDARAVLKSLEFDSQGRLVEACGVNLQQVEPPGPVSEGGVYADVGCITSTYGDDGTSVSTLPQVDGSNHTRTETFTDGGLPLSSETVDAEGNRVASDVWIRNEQGWLLEHQSDLGSTVIRYEYNREGRRTRWETADQDGVATAWTIVTYDDLGRVIATEVVNTTSPDLNCSSTLSYPSDDCVPDLGDPFPELGGNESLAEFLCR